MECLLFVMGKGNETTLRDALDRFIENSNLRQKLNEQRLISSWEELVGKYIHSQTKDIFIKNDKLFIKTDSSVIRQELGFIRSRLISVISRRFGEGFVKEIVLL